MKSLLPRPTVRLLERLQLCFFGKLTYLIPRRRLFDNNAEIPRLETVTLTFRDNILRVYACTPIYGLASYTLDMGLGGRRADYQVARAAQVFHMLRAVFPVVEHLNLDCEMCSTSSDQNDEADRTQWRELFRTFGNVKALYTHDRLIEQVYRSLQPGEGESLMDLLPELKEVLYSVSETSENAIAPFIEARQKAGRPVTVLHHTPVHDRIFR